MKTVLICLLLATTLSLGARTSQMVSLTLEDHHGFHETLGSKDRLSPYQKINWLQIQPYRKVVRAYDTGRSFITTYHENGQPKQYLQIYEGRAHGKYIEWHANGEIKVAAHVIGGLADVEEGSAETYIFDGLTEAWDDCGNPVARIPYQNGEIQGTVIRYGEKGDEASRASFVSGLQHGKSETFHPEGTLAERADYVRGERHGTTVRYGSDGTRVAQEEYQRGRLVYGDYGDNLGVIEGRGVQLVVTSEGGRREIEHREGLPHGAIREYDARGVLRHLVHVADGQKCGEEIIYYPPPLFEAPSEELTPKLELHWQRDELQGTMLSWYPSGKLESRREMAGNQKSGVSTAWYEDGSLMLIEEYRDDQLVKGEYYTPGSSIPESRVAAGTGTATLFDGKGHVTCRIAYLDGTPVS